MPFVLYWGKGPRCGLAEPDTACLDYLASLGSRVRQVYEPGASFKLIFTDTHATLNGHAPQRMEAYFNAVERAARERGFDGCWLSELVFAAEAADAIDLADEPIPDEMLEKLGACAAKWFRGEGTVEEGAARYLQMNMVEKRAVQFAFPRSIFITFNGSEYPQPVPGPHAGLLHVLAAARHEREALVPAGAAGAGGRGACHGGMKRPFV